MNRGTGSPDNVFVKKTSADSDYFLKFYLDSDPFPLAEEDGVSYLTPELERRLERIAGLVENSEKLIIVSGALGGGKTTLAKQLAASLDSFWSIGMVKGGPSMDVDMLARALLEDVAPEELKNAPQPVTAIYKFLEFCDRGETSAVFIIDDADELPADSLKFLLQLFRQRYNETRFRFILLGNETITDRLEGLDADVRPDKGNDQVHLPSFSEQQTSEYVLYRLTACGLNRDSPITEEDIAYIHDVSGGLPRGINHLARQLLVARARGRAGRAGMLLRLALIVVVAGGAAAGYFYMKRTPELTAQQAASMPPAGPVTPTPGPADILVTGPAEPEPEPITAAPQEEPVPPSVPETPVVAAEPIVTAAPPAVEPEPAIVAAPEPVAPQPEPRAGADAPAVETASIPEVESAPEPADIRWREGLHGPDWIRRQPEGTHFLQLINASDVGNVRKMLERMDEFRSELSAYTNYTPSGKPRYLILYGSYADRDAAVAAIEQLPAKLRSLPPWPRARAGILRELESAEARSLPP